MCAVDHCHQLCDGRKTLPGAQNGMIDGTGPVATQDPSVDDLGAPAEVAHTCHSATGLGGMYPAAPHPPRARFRRGPHPIRLRARGSPDLPQQIRDRVRRRALAALSRSRLWRRARDVTRVHGHRRAGPLPRPLRAVPAFRGVDGAAALRARLRPEAPWSRGRSRPCARSS